MLKLEVLKALLEARGLDVEGVDLDALKADLSKSMDGVEPDALAAALGELRKSFDEEHAAENAALLEDLVKSGDAVEAIAAQADLLVKGQDEKYKAMGGGLSAVLEAIMDLRGEIADLRADIAEVREYSEGMEKSLDARSREPLPRRSLERLTPEPAPGDSAPSLFAPPAAQSITRGEVFAKAMAEFNDLAKSGDNPARLNDLGNGINQLEANASPVVINQNLFGGK